MEYRKLGRTGLPVSRLGLGGVFIATHFSGDVETSRAIVRRALDLGVNYIDTAPTYGNSEESLGRALAGLADRFILSTKIGGRPKPFDARDPAALHASVQESLRLLGRETIDILCVHEPDRPGMYDWWTDWRAVEGPVLGVLDDLRRRGAVRFTGLGGTTAYELAHLARSGKFDVVLTAYNYSLLWREAAHEVLPAARALNLGVVAGSPLQQGALARRFDAQLDEPEHWLSKPRREQFRALYRLLDELAAPIVEVAVRFALSNPDIHCVLMGPRSVRELEENVAAAEKGPLPADLLARLDEIAAMVPFRPMCEPFGVGWVLNKPGSWRGPGQ